MAFFDFHFHQPKSAPGIYNLPPGADNTDHYFSVGIHPVDSRRVTDADWHWMEQMIQHENCVAVGECGLDGLISVSEEEQMPVFKRQIELANSYRKPMIIHCVKRFSQLTALKKMATVPMIVHGYNKRRSVGAALQKHDFYLSFGKSILHHVNLQEFVQEFPLDRMFLETDDSDADIADLYNKVAQLKSATLSEIQWQIQQNLKIFNIPHL